MPILNKVFPIGQRTLVISRKWSRPHDLGHLSIQHLCVSNLVKFGSTYHWLCMWLHCLWSWVSPIKTYSTAWLIMNFPRVQAIPSGDYTQSCLSICSASKDFPRKDITNNQSWCYFRSRKPSRDQKNKRFFPRVRLRGERRLQRLYISI